MKKLISGVKWISSMAIHPQGRIQSKIYYTKVIISLLDLLTNVFAGSTWTSQRNPTKPSATTLSPSETSPSTPPTHSLQVVVMMEVSMYSMEAFTAI